MGLKHLLATFAVNATHVLIVEAPGAWRTRVAIEHEVARRGWQMTITAADADALVVAGNPGAQLSDRIESVWDQLPGPRSRALVAENSDPAAVRTALDAVSAELLDTDWQIRDAHERGGFDLQNMPDADEGEGDPDSGDMDVRGSGDMDMDMSPSGIPLAKGAQDRDGLEMDVLHVSLGPVLPFWPAGLVLRCTLQGDVVVEAAADIVEAVTTIQHDVLNENDRVPGRLGATERAALRCDQVAGVLALAGWADGYTAAVRVRDALMVGSGAEAATDLLDGLEHRLRRRWLLRWALHGIGDLDRIEDVKDTPSAHTGDVHDRLLNLIDGARTDLAGTQPQVMPLPELLQVTERLVVGLDLATARLVVASLGIDTVLPGAAASNGPQDAVQG